MGYEDRDWYRDWWRKRHGYVEKATFRVLEAQRQREANAAIWRRLALRVVGIVLLLVFAVMVRRLLR